jgi:lipid-binding SYLF domain-containing protein
MKFFAQRRNDMKNDMKLIIKGTILAVSMLLTGQALAAFTAAEAKKLETDASAAVARFQSETKGAETLFNNAKGILVCPEITKGGFIIGVEGGKCVMQVGGKPVEYYTNRAGKFGFLAGIQWYSLILVFNDQATLDVFRTGKRDFEIGADISVAVGKVGAGGSLDTTNIQSPIVSFIFGEKGLMGDASIQGSSFKKLEVE